MLTLCGRAVQLRVRVLVERFVLCWQHHDRSQYVPVTTLLAFINLATNPIYSASDRLPGVRHTAGERISYRTFSQISWNLTFCPYRTS